MMVDILAAISQCAACTHFAEAIASGLPLLAFLPGAGWEGGSPRITPRSETLELIAGAVALTMLLVMTVAVVKGGVAFGVTLAR